MPNWGRSGRTGRTGRTGGTLLLAALLPLVATAADDLCMLKDRSARIAVVVCPASTTIEALRAAGKAACNGIKPCNAWIWVDADKAPAKAPAADTDMPKSVTGAARAIWIHEANHLIDLQRPH